jgi:hypothetical protein
MGYDTVWHVSMPSTSPDCYSSNGNKVTSQFPS